MTAQRFLLTVFLVIAPLMPGAAASQAQPPVSLTTRVTARAPAMPGDEYWATGFSFPGIDGLSVNALTSGPDGSLYAAGWFWEAGWISVNNIARWDGAQWHSLGSGMNGSVNALAFGPDGSLYASGHFTAAGGVAANNIARWDGSQWRLLGSGMDSGVADLALGPDGSLYAGGIFTIAGGKASSYIAQWTGSTTPVRRYLPLILHQ